MRLVHVIDTLDPAHGGPSTVCAALGAAQAALGHDVTIVQHEARDPARVDAMLRAVPGADKLNIVSVPRGRRTGAASARAQLRSAIPGADMVILHGVWDRLLLSAAAAAHRANTRSTIVPHGMLRQWTLAHGRMKKRIALALMVRRVLDRAAMLHALNADEAADLRLLGLRARIEVIPNGVFLEEVDPLPPRGTFAAAHPWLGGRPFILFLSRLHHKKGLDYLADAFALVARRRPDIALVVAGPDDGERAPFMDRIARLGLGPRVYLPGPLYARDKFAALADAACFCLPSRSEGFSVAVLEALACRCPAVISDACSFPELAQAGAGEVVPLDPTRIAEALLRVLDPDTRHSMSTAARALVESRYTWPRIAERTIECYQKP